MKQLYEEAYKVTQWCSCCHHTYWDEKNDAPDRSERWKSWSMCSSELLKGLLDVTVSQEIADGKGQGEIEELHVDLEKGLVTAVDENTVIIESEKSEDDEWLDWEQRYELYMEDAPMVRCPYIRKKGLEVHIDREFVIPEDEHELLRLLDKLSQCYTPECRFNDREHLGVRTLDGMLRVALAKIDFALLERGKDYGKLMHEMYFPYYERKTDLEDCGYSWDLIRYYLDKYGITLKSNEEYEAEDSRPQVADFKSKQEYKDALVDGKCDKNGKLLVKKAEYTRYVVEKYDIRSSYKQFWTRFDNIFSDDSGKVISFRTFMQSFRDQDLG
jgi:hypothetical protein